MGIPFASGLQYVLDTQQQFVQAGLPVYLRVNNFTDAQEGDALEVGVPYTASGTFDCGFIDILISPPPSVRDVSLHNIGIFGGRLNFGSRIFLISNTFVRCQLETNSFKEANVTDPYAVWRNRDGKRAIGLFYDNRIFAIESITHREIAAQTVSWTLVGNAEEEPTTVQGGP